jgi:hypothetical protein
MICALTIIAFGFDELDDLRPLKRTEEGDDAVSVPLQKGDAGEVEHLVPEEKVQ